ncbi:MAG: hypothetical protein GXP27_02945 [Planctomycetes bacterium]|nr:hypothetical protein [Planctomycetota bacterium]
MTVRTGLFSALFLCVGLPALVVAQNSELPLQQGETAQAATQKLVQLLQSPDASLHDKAVACKRLALFADKSAVPVLAKLLTDEKLSHYARFALEPIPDPAVDAALRTALKQVKGRLLVGVINSIGQRQDAGAIGDLKQLLSDSDPQVAAAAAAALGRIGTPATAAILKKELTDASAAQRAAAADACLACAETLLKKGQKNEAIALYDAVRQANLLTHQRVAGTFGAIRARGADGVALIRDLLSSKEKAFFGVALRAARELGGKAAAQALLQALKTTSPERKAKVILALGDIGGPGVREAIVKAAKGGPKIVQDAAVRSLRKVGDVSVLPVLLDLAIGDDAQLAETAVGTLEVLPGQEVDEAIRQRLATADNESLPVLIDLAGRRRIASATDLVLKAADSSDSRVRLAAVKALGEILPVEKLDVLWQRAVAARSAEEKAVARQALQAACIRAVDRDACVKQLSGYFDQAPTDAKIYLLELLSAVGGETALKTVAQAARSSDEQIQDAATRVLGGWMSPDAAPVLLELAQSLSSKKYRIRSLRGCIRIVRQLDFSLKDRLAMCRKIMQAAERKDEKKLVLQILSRNASPEALEEAISYMADRDIRADAAWNAVGIGERIVHAHPKAVAAAMQKLLDAGFKGSLAARARALLERAK